MEWIKISNELPPDRKRVLTYIPGLHWPIQIHVYHENYGAGPEALWIGEMNFPVGDISHWMEIPDEPPEGE